MGYWEPLNFSQLARSTGSLETLELWVVLSGKAVLQEVVSLTCGVCADCGFGV